MFHPSIDNDLCIGCGACTKACPSSQLVLSAGKAVPNLMPPRPCHGCGHCYAVCPVQAITIMMDGIAMENPSTEAGNWRIPEETLGLFLQMRRSVRFFKDKPVPRETLEKVLDYVRWSPTGCNRQSLGWMVLTDPAERKRLGDAIAEWAVRSEDYRSVGEEYLNGHDTVLRNAPCVILVHAPDTHLSIQDSAIALEYLGLLLTAAGLGYCWSGLSRQTAAERPELMDFLGLEPGRRIFGGLMVGYPDVRFLRIPPRKPASIIWR